MQELLNAIASFAPLRVRIDEPMSRHTTFRVGGPADLMFFPESANEIARAMFLAKEYGKDVLVMGNGSNLIVRDGGFRGLVIVLGEHMARIDINDTCVRAQAGAMLARVSAAAQEAGLAGFEFASGIPGTLGGGCAMNAGAYGGQLSDALVSAEVLMDGEIRTLSNADMQMSYRNTLPLRTGGIVLSAKFTLRRDDPDAILTRMKDLNVRRREKQPLNLPSAGSTFKRPEGYYAGALIEGCGLKGARVGGAQVSEKHAGFIVNVGGATAADILALIDLVRQRVLSQAGVMLEPEVRIVGED